ncbi:hypothetical protein Tco_0574146 [Tanacetum coccineum]
MDKEINLEKKIKELDNIVYKVGQSAQTVHMLTKPQVFYDDTHKQALGYQNSFYLKKAQRIKSTLYDGSVISSQHAANPVIDDEDTLILEEASRSKMLAKQNDPMLKEKKVNNNLISYVELNRLSEYFGKRFVPQQEFSDEQALSLQTSHPNTDQSASSPVKIKAPKELPKASLVNKSLKKLKYHLGQFDTVVKKQITPDAITEGEWGFEHTKAVFLNEIIPFLKTLKDIFNVFDKDLLNEVMEVQTVFNQIEVVVQQCSVDKQCFEIHKKDFFLENDRLLHQIMSQDVMICVMNSTAVFDDVNLEMKKSESCNKCLDLDADILNKQNAYNNICDLKAQLQAKDTTIYKLKERVKSMRENNKEEKVKQEMDEIETINIELEHNQFDSIKKTRALSKEHYDSLIAQLNSKSMENADLKSQIQDKVFVTTALQNELWRLKGKLVLDDAITITNATTITPGMFKLDIEPLSHRLKNNRDAHKDYLKKTIENTDTIRGLVEGARKQNPSEPLLDSACKFIKHVKELLVYVSQTCPSFKKSSQKLVAVTPMNKVKKVRFLEPLTSSRNIHKPAESSKTSDSDTLVLSSSRLKSSTSFSRSQPTGNKKNDRISQTPSRNMKNKVKDHPKRVKSKSNKKNRVKDPMCDANVKHTMLNANSELICVKCKQCMFDANHDVCFHDFVNDVNVHFKYKW